MDWRKLREQCLALPGSVEEFPFGDEVSVFKVGGKMFALSHLDGEPLQVSVADEMVSSDLRDWWCPGMREEWARRGGCVY
jgi:predicted DNA-binding protein (MmcQ/YjbR family)